MVRTWLFLAVLLALALTAPLLPAWSQSPGLTDPMVAPNQKTPTSMAPRPSSARSWNLTDLLWGIARLQESPRKLSAQQKAKIRPAVTRVLEGARIATNFEARVKGILSTDQLAFIGHLALSGQLAGEPPGLPKAPPGQDPLVLRVVQILEARAKK